MPIYLDYNATNLVRPEVLGVINAVLEQPANPSSVHALGRQAKKYVEDARQVVADTISCWPDEVIFTSSGTEANATALGCAKGDVIISSIEHSSVWNRFSKDHIDRHIPVDANGHIIMTSLEGMLEKFKPQLVSVMLANNETGVINNIAEIAKLCKAHGTLLHCDAAQGLGKMRVDVGALGVDMLTLSAHKCGGPVGAAALVIRRGAPFTPLLTGGGQEGRRRAGTENVAAIAGFAKAVECIDLDHMRKLRGWLTTMEETFMRKGGIVFGSDVLRLPNTSCVAMPDVSNEVQLMDFDLNGFCVSAGSACSSGRVETSHVLLAMGISEIIAQCAIRISGGWNTKESEIQDFTKIWVTICERLATKNAFA
ncbi:MAG: cysteine desulfurase family protein [Alphaproteobacteria bacterium]